MLRRGDEGMRRLPERGGHRAFRRPGRLHLLLRGRRPNGSRILDALFDLAVEAIFRPGGTLDKFIGDCVMAFFGAPVAQPDHALRAVRAALEIQARLAAWNARRVAEGLPGFKARVALNSGPVVVGDIGSARRVDYTVLGNTVNVASRLEGVAPPDEIVIGSETHRLLGAASPPRRSASSSSRGAAEDPGLPWREEVSDPATGTTGRAPRSRRLGLMLEDSSYKRAGFRFTARRHYRRCRCHRCPSRRTEVAAEESREALWIRPRRPPRAACHRR